MMMELAEPIILLASIFGVFLWLRNDIKNFRDDVRKDIQQLCEDTQDDIQQLRKDTQDDIQQVRNDIRRLETKVDGLDSRLRAVESEQSRVAGLLEGLGLAGALPTRDE